MSERLTVKQVGERLAKVRGLNKPMTHTYVMKLIHKGRLIAQKNEHNLYVIETKELERFIGEDFNVSKPRGRNARKINSKIYLLRRLGGYYRNYSFTAKIGNRWRDVNNWNAHRSSTSKFVSHRLPTDVYDASAYTFNLR